MGNFSKPSGKFGQNLTTEEDFRSDPILEKQLRDRALSLGITNHDAEHGGFRSSWQGKTPEPVEYKIHPPNTPMKYDEILYKTNLSWIQEQYTGEELQEHLTALNRWAEKPSAKSWAFYKDSTGRLIDREKAKVRDRQAQELKDKQKQSPLKSDEELTKLGFDPEQVQIIKDQHSSTPQPIVAPSPVSPPEVQQATQQALNNQTVNVPASPPPVQKAINHINTTVPIVVQPTIPPVVTAVNPVAPISKPSNQGGSRPPPNVPPPIINTNSGSSPQLLLGGRTYQPYVSRKTNTSIHNPTLIGHGSRVLPPGYVVGAGRRYIPETSWKLPTRPLPVKALDNLDRVNITPVGMIANLYGSSQTSSPGVFSNLLDTIGGNINRRVSAVGSIYRQDILDTLHGGDLKKALKLFHTTRSSNLRGSNPTYSNLDLGHRGHVTSRYGIGVGSNSDSWSEGNVNIFYRSTGVNSLSPNTVSYSYNTVPIPKNTTVSIPQNKFNRRIFNNPNNFNLQYSSNTTQLGFSEMSVVQPKLNATQLTLDINSTDVSGIKIRKQDLLSRNTSKNPSFYRGDIHTPQTSWSRSSSPWGHSNIPTPNTRVITTTSSIEPNSVFLDSLTPHQLDYFHTLNPKQKESWMKTFFSGVSEDQIGDMALDKHGVNLEGMTNSEKVWAIAGSKAKRVGLKASNYYRKKAIEAGADPAAWLGHAVKSSKPFRLAKAIGSLGLDVGSAGLAMTYNAYKIGTNNKPLFHQDGETLKFNESARNLIIRGVAGATILKSIRNAANYRNPRVHTDDYTSSGYGNLGNPSDQMLDLYYQHR